jgi:DNA-directed RNA polymerase alpha subunit
LNLETDGTITPAAAINYAAKILIDHFSLLFKEEPIIEKLAEKKISKEKTKKTKKTTKKSKK